MGEKEMKKKKLSVLICTMLIVASISMLGTTTADWDPEDGHKMHWPQLPDPNGWDVYATAGLDQYPWVCAADDWQCSETGYIKDIHFWGSWYNDLVGEIDHFVIGIAANIPPEDNPNGYWSMPGETFVEWEIYDWVERGPYNGNQGWYWSYDEGNPWEPNNHQLYWQYNVFLDEQDWFWQEEGTIYWLFISAIVKEDPTGQPLWGWKSTTEDLQFMDAAVWGLWGELYWLPLHHPTGVLLDLAFVITGGDEHDCNPSIDVKKYVWDPDNEDWVLAPSASGAIDITIDTIARFKIVMYNDGGPPLNPEVEDDMEAAGLEFVNSDPPPSSDDDLVIWNDLDPLEPNATQEIIVEARVVGEHCNTYYQKVTVIAYCICGEPDCDCPPTVKTYYAYIHAVGDDPPPNNPPLKPATPSGETSGNAGDTYTYTTSTIDPDGDQISYLFDWGDSTTGSWTTPVASGTTISESHSWANQDTYSIKVKARDTHGDESEWSDPLQVEMPKALNMPFLQFLQNYPLLYYIIQLILQL
jgi:hypothetical protein